MQDDFFSQYLSYTGETEVPAFFSRWAAIAGIGAYLGRQYYFQHGSFNINPNMYCMLIGSAGTRKGTAIKLLKQLLTEAGYNKFSSERTSKEKFLSDLAGEGEEGLLSPDDLLDQNLFGESSVGGARADCEMFIAIDEFNDFIGNGNIEFISMLGNMWDYSGLYKNRIKTSKSVEIYNPTISILGGNTPTGFSLAFPPEILGQGFFSRILLIYGEPNGKSIAFPPAPDKERIRQLLETLKFIKSFSYGQAGLDALGTKLLKKIYDAKPKVNDVRFESYSNRRFTHLLKLCLIVSASRSSKEISEADVIYANTILTFTEQLMPKALGEFGKSRHSDVSHKIVQLLDSTDKVLSFKDIWAHVHNDLEKMKDLQDLLIGQVTAGKIQQVVLGEINGFLPKRRLITETDSSTVDYSILTEEERRLSV